MKKVGTKTLLRSSGGLKKTRDCSARARERRVDSSPLDAPPGKASFKESVTKTNLLASAAILVRFDHTALQGDCDHDRPAKRRRVGFVCTRRPIFETIMDDIGDLSGRLRTRYSGDG